MSDEIKSFESNRHLMDLYSRQIGAYGVEAMTKLVQLKVLIVGMKGVGAETAKNVILAGANTVAIHDAGEVQPADLGSNCFLLEADLKSGQRRDELCVPRLAELNEIVTVKVEPELTEESISQYSCVVFTDDTKLEDLIKWNEFCRSQTRTVVDERGTPTTVNAPISFISCFTCGGAGSLFVDHGPELVVRDKDGQQPLIKLVRGMECHEEEVTGPDGKKYTEKYTLVRYLNPVGQSPVGFLDGMCVEFSEVEGMHAKDDTIRSKLGYSLNESGTWRVWSHYSDPKHSFRIGCTEGFTAYLGGGVITQVKQPETLRFRSLAECLKQPSTGTKPLIDTFEKGENDGFVMLDQMKAFDPASQPGAIEAQIHAGVQAIRMFQMKHDRLPQANSEEDENACVELAKEFNRSMEIMNAQTPGTKNKCFVVDIDEKALRRIVRYASIELLPMCTFFGGVVAQEIVKVTGKYTPIRQFLNYSVIEALPEDDKRPKDVAPTGSRYDNQIAVFGKAFQDRLAGMKVFMVGCGALGCEYIKNFALMGLCLEGKGELHVSDNDRIELSNLSRQFLFRRENQNDFKSKAAAQRAKIMNPEFKVVDKQELVEPATENIFDDDFWESLDFVCNALDNMKARFYVDGKCVLHEKPLLESGTMGTGANVDIIVPHKTNSYADGGEADETGGIPMCTLRNFPHLIDHCIEWARAKFTDLFVAPAQEASTFLKAPEDFIAKQKSETLEKPPGGDRESAIASSVTKLRQLYKTIQQASKKPTIKDCVEMAFMTFHELYRDTILDLISKFPEDHKTESGNLFWSGHKKFPTALHFNPEDPLHLNFVIAAANLFACMLKVHPTKHTSEKNRLFKNRWMSEYREAEWARNAVSKLQPPEYSPGQVTDLDEESSSGALDDDGAMDEELETLFDRLHDVGVGKSVEMEALDFEKDDDDNFHIDFITACANLRAANYGIPQASPHKCKMIAGRIIPALATTTASVTGLVMMELYKVLLEKPVETFKNGNFDLGSNTYTLFEPMPPKQISSHTVKKFDSDSYKTEMESYSSTIEMYSSRMDEMKRLLGSMSAVDGVSEDSKKAVQREIDNCQVAMDMEEEPNDADFKVEEDIVAVPEKHTKWDKILIPKDVGTLEELVGFFKEKYNVNMSSWSMTDDQGRGIQVYPTPEKINYSILPDKTASKIEAFKALSSKVRPDQVHKYLALWEKKRTGQLEEVAQSDEDPLKKPIRKIVEDVSGQPLLKRRKIQLPDIQLNTEEGKAVTAASIVLSC